MMEKRQFNRTPVAIPVAIRHGTRVIWECLENISRGGAYIRGARIVEQGDRLELSFSFPGLAEPVLQPCRVVRRDRGGIGVHFVPYPVGAS